MNPRFSSRYISLAGVVPRHPARTRMSSMYATSLTPSSLREVRAGFGVLVKTHGAQNRPNGRHVNWKTVQDRKAEG